MTEYTLAVLKYLELVEETLSNRQFYSDSEGESYNDDDIITLLEITEALKNKTLGLTNVPGSGAMLRMMSDYEERLATARAQIAKLREQRDSSVYDWANEVDYYGTPKSQSELSDKRIAKFDAELNLNAEDT